MEKINAIGSTRRVSKKSLFSFLAFLLSVIKDIILALGIIRPRSPANYIASYLVVIPILFVALIFSIQEFYKWYKHKRKDNSISFFTLNNILCLPAILCFFYVIIYVIIVLFHWTPDNV